MLADMASAYITTVKRDTYQGADSVGGNVEVVNVHTTGEHNSNAGNLVQGNLAAEK